MEKLKKLSPHLIVILLFVGISFAYFSPLLEGKRLDMPDIKNHIGMSKEVVDFREATGDEALWTNSMFSGMPAYQISTKSNANLIQYVVKAISLGIPRPANLLFLYLLGFYILNMIHKNLIHGKTYVYVIDEMLNKKKNYQHRLNCLNSLLFHDIYYLTHNLQRHC